jgi:Serine dehydrogenase proteinase
MPGWSNVLAEIGQRQKEGQQAIDLVRRKYLKSLHTHTGRNVIAYYSGWLNRPAGTPNLQVGDDDMNAFMAAVHQLKREKGLDLILHTPGGDIAATEALVKYLWTMFEKDIRVIVPQLAMSAGTMIACSSKQIIMGKQSSLGPIDPQIFGMPAQAILDEFQLAIESIKKDPTSTPLWQQIVSRYHPSFLVECVQAIKWSKTMVHSWLCENMFSNDSAMTATAQTIVDYLSDHATTATHSRHLSQTKCAEIKLNVTKLEDDKKLQDLVLTVHHAYMHTFSMSPAIKITENHLGVATVLMGVMQQPHQLAPGQALVPEGQIAPPLTMRPPLTEPTVDDTGDSK